MRFRFKMTLITLNWDFEITETLPYKDQRTTLRIRRVQKTRACIPEFYFLKFYESPKFKYIFSKELNSFFKDEVGPLIERYLETEKKITKIRKIIQDLIIYVWCHQKTDFQRNTTDFSSFLANSFCTKTPTSHQSFGNLNLVCVQLIYLCSFTTFFRTMD